jgi:PAS domain S-box-containing protein
MAADARTRGDMSESRRAQEALRAAEELFRRAFEDAPIGMGIVGMDNRWLRVNRALCEMTGYGEEELLALTFLDVTHPDDLEADLAQGVPLLAGEKDSVRIEKRIRRRDGSARWIMASVSLVRDPDGAPLYSVAQWEDISDRKRVQAELERMLTLERIHVERLRTLDRVKDEFVAGASHELRTPLTSIQGYAELLLDGTAGELNDDQRTYLLTIHRNGERLERLVDDLLFAARADAGKLELTLAEIDLEQLVLECVESARPAAEQQEIRLECSTEPVAPIAGDAARLSQLLDNLVSNGIKFTPAGGSVSVTLAANGGSAVIDVSDTGIGIPSGERPRLFERFFRSTLATERAIQGTGLGLSITKDIAESHGGRIDCESTEGKGTTFRVELPFAGAASEPSG